ncbi:hypothetical protein JJQ72_09930 [Paenibacillus sp. F411]|uniref:hypothetical protein n=1 Tax=Paenibacillus sp. F411 TaxID=2820239 RepID=UPI001AAE3F84|nr:hypothetical protein [Paenibacillus sp. F411]MBO2944285.1 hypothetical protein [Paenibacillus sp. F411]
MQRLKGSSNWQRLSAVLILICASFWIQSVTAPTASALLKEIVEPVLKPVRPAPDPSEPAASNAENAEQKGIPLKVPSIQLDTPIVKVKTPEVVIEAEISQPAVRINTSTTTVEAPLVTTQLGEISADVKPEGRLLPQVKVEAPSVQVETLGIQAEASKATVAVKPDEGIVPSVQIQSPAIKAVTSELKASVPSVDVKAEEPLSKSNPPAQSVPTPADSAVPVASLQKDTSFSPQTSSKAREDEVGISDTENEERNELPKPITEAPVLVNVTDQSDSDLNVGEPEAAVNEQALVSETRSTPYRGNARAGENQSNEPVASEEKISLAEETSGNTSNDPTQKNTRPSVALVPLNTSTGSAGSNTASNSLGNSGSSYPITNLTDKISGVYYVTSVVLQQQYLLGSDQWSQPPPGQPPQQHTFLSPIETQTFN